MKTKILFLVTEDWVFILHRLALAQRLMAEGYTVAVACRVNGRQAGIERAGIRVFPIAAARESVGPTAVLRACAHVRRTIRNYGPDLIHAVSLRSILLGWMAGLGLRRKPCINLITGLGSLFSGRLNRPRLWAARLAVEIGLRLALRPARTLTVFQNNDDLEMFRRRRMIRPRQARLIRGSGIDDTRWTPLPEPSAPPVVGLFAGRFLRDKGLGELLEAVRLLRQRGVDFVLRLAGDPDSCNPESFSAADVRAWVEKDGVVCLGRTADVFQAMSAAHLVVLPSYREGLPRVLLEAGVARRAVVTCDVPGCREAVCHMENGLLTPVRNATALADALETLARDPALRLRLAARHAERVRTEFSDRVIHAQFVDLYRELLGTPAGR